MADVTYSFKVEGSSTTGAHLLVTLSQGGTALTFAESGYTGQCDGRLSTVTRDGTTTTGTLTLMQGQYERFDAGLPVEIQANVVWPDEAGGEHYRAATTIQATMLPGPSVMLSLNVVPRVVVYDRMDAYKCDLNPTQVMELRSTEQVNGEHSLTIKTTQVLARSDRILLQDAQGKWHEWVVLGDEITHPNATIHSYYCIWSLQYDLMGTYIDTQVGIVPGHASVPSAARLALEAALSGTTRWAIGTISTTAQASASFYRRSGWDGIKTVIENWGGEVDATITVGTTGVTGRAVNLLDHVGSSTAVRRFDYSRDLAGIKADLPEQPIYCRIVPLSKSEQTENGGYTRRKTIESVNGGIVWLEDANMVDYAKIKNGAGTDWEYPTLIVTNDTYEEPSDLKEWALDHITDYTQPLATYEASVVQLAQAGMNVHGVALGDAVHVVDKTFSDSGLRLDARVIKQVVNLLDPSDIKLTIGTAKATLAGQFQNLSSAVARLNEATVSTGDYQASAAYLANLIAELNEKINATGGYAYITEGAGFRTYDVPVSDPTVGSEASAVVEIRGGTVRIADSKTPQGDWEWRTVFLAGHVAAELITAANIVTGYIGNAYTGTFIDLDNNIVRLGGPDETHVIVQDDSLNLVDLNGDTYLYVSDENNPQHYVTIYEQFFGDGTTTAFSVRFTVDTISSVVKYTPSTSASVGYTSTTLYQSTDWTRSSNTITLNVAPASGEFIRVSYRTYQARMRTFTFGSRDGSVLAGPYSATFGIDNIARREGTLAVGVGTYADTSGQIALGRYNKSWPYGPLVIGAGNGPSSRKNLLEMTWDGRIRLDNPLPVASGGAGMSEITTVTTISDVVSTQTNVTVSSVTLKKWGLVVQLRVAFKFTTSKVIPASGSSMTSMNLFTLASSTTMSVRPASQVTWQDESSFALGGYISSSGVAYLTKADTYGTQHETGTTSTYYLNAVYLTSA